MNIQALRNITTGKLHTEVSDVYLTIGYLTGQKGIITHQLPNAYTALLPLLKKRDLPPRLWDNQYDPTHTGDIEVPSLTPDEKAKFWQAYSNMPGLLD